MIVDLLALAKLVTAGLALMLPLGNPLTSVSLLLALGNRYTPAERSRQVDAAAFYVVAIMLVVFYLGSWIMHSFGISIPGLRIAGGLIVAFLGFNMLFPSTTVTDIPEVEHTLASHDRSNTPSIAFVPLAMPGTAGPGSIAMIISLASTYHGQTHIYSEWVRIAAPIIVALLLGLLFWVCLRCSDKIVRLIGKAGVEAISRLMGFLLVCMGVQFVINGTLEVVAQAVH